jgi:hypothetical protein
MPQTTPSARIFGPDREEIVDLRSWFDHAPPEKGEAQWRDGYSAKEQAKAWLRGGTPTVPAELWSVIRPIAGDVDLVHARPEHRTRLDKFSRPRQHDLLACFRRDGSTTLLVGVEAKACENFDGHVRDRAAAVPPSKKRARCNLLARALFDREVFDEESGAILDARLADHGYQLWTAAVGTLIEAQQRDLEEAALVVHQFVPEDFKSALDAGDTRQWRAALEANEAAFESFRAALEAVGGSSFETPFVRGGTRLRVLKVEARFRCGAQ